MAAEEQIDAASLTRSGVVDGSAGDPLTKMAGRIAGRYDVRRKLGSGGMSTVYQAFDHKNETEVAIKFMKHDLGGSARRRFFREFNTIAGIQHPCCLRVHEIGETDDAPYFTMELHPGRPLNSLLGEAPQAIAPVLVDLTLAVDYIHSQGIVHRDIKPSNVLVEQTADGDGERLSCKLADFGLAKFYQLDSSLTAERGIVGTPAYCAPEQIDAVEVDHRVDLYAMGLLAFELLSGGQHPFAAERSMGMHQLLHAQLSKPAPRLADINPHVSDELSDVIGSYLAKEPDLRPQSAAPLRRALCEQYGIEVEARLERLSSPSEVNINAIGFVCREAELEHVDMYLRDRFHRSSDHGTPRAANSKPLLLFTGTPGAGKSCTMREAMRRAIGAGFLVFEGRCFDTGGTSFQPIIEIVRQILSRIARANRAADESTLLIDFRTNQSQLQRMSEILFDYRNELLLIAPELRRWFPSGGYETVLQSDPEYIYRALSTMFLELGEVCPLCLCLDDIQWADNSTLAFLCYLSATINQASAGDDRQQPGAAPALMATGRKGYEQVEEFRTRMESQSLIAEIELDALDLEETRELLALRLGCLASSIVDELVAAIDKLCQGNPFFISETIREWYSRGMVVRTTDGWQRIHSTIDEESSLPSSVRSALRTRLSELSETAATLLPVAAALGKVVDLDLLTDVVPETNEGSHLDAVDELLNKRIFVETNKASHVSFAHDLLREEVLSELSSNRRRALHRRIAQALESQKETAGRQIAPALLAHHYLAGEMTEQAFTYLLEAAELAAKAYAFEDARDFLQQATDNLPPDVPAATLFRLYSLFAEVMAHMYELDAATRYASQALAAAVTPIERGQSLQLLGRYANLQGDRPKAREWFDQSLDALGMPLSKWWPAQLLAIQFNLLCCHLLPLSVVALFNRTSRRRAQLAVACEVIYEFCHSIIGHDVIAYTNICTLNLRLAKTLDSNSAKAVAHTKYALNMAFGGLNAQIGIRRSNTAALSVRYCKLGMAFVEKENRPNLKSSLQSALGFCYYCAGQLDEAERCLKECEKPLLRCRDLHTSYCYHFLRHVYSVQGDSEKVIEAGLKELELAALSNDRELMGWAQFGLTHGYALSGRLDESLRAAEEAIRLLGENESSFTVVAYMEQGFALMQAGKYAEAIESYRKARARMNQRLFYFEISMPMFPRLAEAYLGPDWHNSGQSRECDVRAAGKQLRLAKIFCMSFPNVRPHTWRIRGRRHFAMGRQRSARKSFERAIAEAKKIGARYDLARAMFDSAMAFPELADRKEQALALLDELGAVLPAAELESTRS